MAYFNSGVVIVDNQLKIIKGAKGFFALIM